MVCKHFLCRCDHLAKRTRISWGHDGQSCWPTGKGDGGEGETSTILDQLASGWIHRQLESPEEINPQDGHLDFSCRKVHLKHRPDSFSCTSFSPQHLIVRPVGLGQKQEGWRMRDDAESSHCVHQETSACRGIIIATSHAKH
jgi:hypothetical protein